MRGRRLLEYLETVPLRVDEVNGPVRFPVQLVLRPDAKFRGFAGQVARGVLAGWSEGDGASFAAGDICAPDRYI